MINQFLKIHHPRAMRKLSFNSKRGNDMKNVMVLPLMALFFNGKVERRMIGLMESKEEK